MRVARTGNPAREQIATLALYLCRDAAAQITGTNLSMDGGWTAQ